jgi:hypothetical protein
MINYIKEQTMGICEKILMRNQISFLGLVLTVKIMFNSARKLEGEKKCIHKSNVLYFINLSLMFSKTTIFQAVE